MNTERIKIMLEYHKRKRKRSSKKTKRIYKEFKEANDRIKRAL